MSAIQTAGVLDTGDLCARTLTIYMTRETVRDKFEKYLGAAIERVVIDIDGEQHEYDADMVISALEDYGRIAELEAELQRSYDAQTAKAEELTKRGVRIAELESLVRDWCELYESPDYGDCIRLRKRMRALGIEVDA